MRCLDRNAGAGTLVASCRGLFEYDPFMMAYDGTQCYELFGSLFR